MVSYRIHRNSKNRLIACMHACFKTFVDDAHSKSRLHQTNKLDYNMLGTLQCSLDNWHACMAQVLSFHIIALMHDFILNIFWGTAACINVHLQQPS